MNIFERIRLRFMTPMTRANFLRKNNLLDIGIDSEVHSDVSFGSEPYLIKIGRQVRITNGVRFVNHDGSVWVLRNLKNNNKLDKIQPIIIGDNVFIGINSIILPGVTIGSNVIIGAGSIVTKDIPSDSVAAGTPAKVLSKIENYFEKNIGFLEDTKELGLESKKKFYKMKYKEELDNV